MSALTHQHNGLEVVDAEVVEVIDIDARCLTRRPATADLVAARLMPGRSVTTPADAVRARQRSLLGLYVDARA